MARGGPLAAWLGPALREENHDHHRSNGSSRPGEPRQWDLPPCSRAPPAIRAACLALAQRAAALAQAPFFIRPVTPHALPPPSQRQKLRPVEHLQPALGAGLQRSVDRQGSPRISVRAFPLHSGKAEAARDPLPAVATHRFCCRRGRTPSPPRQTRRARGRRPRSVVVPPIARRSHHGRERKPSQPSRCGPHSNQSRNRYFPMS